MTTRFFVMLIVPIAIRWMQRYAENSKARRRHGALVFPATSLTVLCAVSLILALTGTIGMWREQAGAFLQFIGIAWAVCMLLLWPTTIVLDQKGVTAKHIWRPTRFIPYAEIDYVVRMYDRKAIVYGNGKVREIPISEFHVGDEELEHEFRKRHVKYYGSYGMKSL